MADDTQHVLDGSTADGEARVPLLAGRTRTIRELGYDEHWL